jgi:hypothetical protein
MTNKEAKVWFEEDLKDGKCSDSCPQCNAMELAIKALDKQIPKKVDIKKYIYTKCDCGYTFSVHYGDGYYDVPYKKQTRYCPDCGQALDWSDTE